MISYITMSSPLPMKNIGSTCHANVIFQTLLSCLAFNRANVLYGTKNWYTSLYDSFVQRNSVVFNNLLLKIKNNLKIIKGQQDSHETLDKIFTFLAHRSKFAVSHFIGKNTTEYYCMACGHSVVRQEDFKELVLSINGLSTISECINNYYATEKLVDYSCDECKQKSVIKRSFLTNAPRYLFIVFNRFKPNNKKSNKVINYTKNIDITHTQLFSSDRLIEYSLKAVINHIGTVESGHYYSYNKYNDDDWYKCDDTQITKNPKYINSNNAYILLYQLI